MYSIDGKKLKQILTIERGLTMKGVSKNTGFHDGYLSDAVIRNRLSSKVVKILHDKYEINPARYIPGWKGERTK